MRDDVENLILKMLLWIDRSLVKVEIDVGELKIRSAAVDAHFGGMFIALSGVNTPLNRTYHGLTRVEHRFERSEAR